MKPVEEQRKEWWNVLKVASDPWTKAYARCHLRYLGKLEGERGKPERKKVARRGQKTQFSKP